MNKELPNLYVLRLFLALLVVVFHIPISSSTLNFPSYNDLAIFNKGNLAVIYFFTLSGFLIIRLLYLEIESTSTINFKAFYLKRIIRLYPVYYLVLLIGILLYNVVLPYLAISFPVDYKLSDLILSYVFFIPNIFNTHYKVGSVLNIMWSIGIEEQFYLFAPFALYLGRNTIVKTIVVLLCIFLVILFFYSDFFRFKNYYFYFLAGGLIAVLSEKGSTKFLDNIFLKSIIYLLFGLSFFSNFFMQIPSFIVHLLNLIISSLFIAIIAYYPTFILKNNFLNYLGKISYGIYMYHMIVVTGVLFILKKVNCTIIFNNAITIIIINLLILAVTAFVAHLSYQYFEKRFYRIK